MSAVNLVREARTMRIGKKHLIHAMARCRDCTWSCQEYFAAQRKSAAHAKKENHRVHIELGYWAEYTPQNTEHKS